MLLHKKIKSLFEKSKFYMRIRYSTLVVKIWLLIRKDVSRNYKAKHNLYQSILPADCQLIFDIGANEGMLTEIFRLQSKHVIAVEPSNRNLAILQAKFFNKKNIQILPVAVSNFSGEQPWFEDKNDYATGTLSRKWNNIKQQNKQPVSAAKIQIKTITLDELLQKFGLPDYIKIDVEGNELPVIKGLSQQVPFLSFEAILPQFLSETIQCIELLCAIAPSVFNYTCDDRFVYQEYKSKEILLADINTVQVTIDIFCRMQ